MGHRATPDERGRLYVPVTLYSEDHRRRWMGQALVDTGAQFALVHPSVIRELGLTARGEADLDSAIGPGRTRAYILRVVVADIMDDFLSALETHSQERFVLGRQFLQRTRLEVDWPAKSFELTKAG